MMRRLFGLALAAILFVPASSSLGAEFGNGPVATARLDVDNDGHEDLVTWTLTPRSRFSGYVREADASVSVRFAKGTKSTISLPPEFRYTNPGISIYTTSISVMRLDPDGPPVLVVAVQNAYRQLGEHVTFVRVLASGRRHSLAAVRFAGTGEVAVFENRSGWNTAIGQLEAAVGCDPRGGYVDQYRLFPSGVLIGRGQLERKRFRWSGGVLQMGDVDSTFDGTVQNCGKVSGESVDVLERFSSQIDPDLSGPDPVPTPPVEPTASGISQVSAIRGRCWLLANRTVRCRGNLRGDSTSPFDRSFNLDTFGGPVSGAHGVVDLAARTDRACAVLVNGSVRCWGWNTTGLLGDGTRRMRNFSVRAYDFSTATNVFVGDYSTCVLDADSRPSCWGTYNNWAAFGPVAPLVGPVRIDGVEDVESIWMGVPFRRFGERQESCALLRSSQVWCWDSVGSASGVGNSLVPTEVHPLREVALDGATQIATGSGQLCGLISGGVIRCPRSGFESRPGFAEVAVTPTTVCGRRAVGTLTCWEDRATPFETSFDGPIEVPVTDAVSLSDGPCAITPVGAKCWTVTNGGASPIKSFVEPWKRD